MAKPTDTELPDLLDQIHGMLVGISSQFDAIERTAQSKRSKLSEAAPLARRVPRQKRVARTVLTLGGRHHEIKLIAESREVTTDEAKEIIAEEIQARKRRKLALVPSGR